MKRKNSFYVIACKKSQKFLEFVHRVVKNLIPFRFGQFPKTLFKYTTLETLKKGLEMPSVYFSAATDFNDPFELKYKLDSNYTKDDWIAYFNKREPQREGCEALAEWYMNNPQKAHEFVSGSIEEQIKDTGILCLTTHNDNLLMWAHYADSHRGVCIEYVTMNHIMASGILKKVKYSNQYIRFNYIKEPDRLKKCIFHKSCQWSYENEYRIVRQGSVKEPIGIPPKAIKGIYFGCNCSDNKINEIREIINKKGWTHIQLKKAEIDDSAFKLNFREISF
ncbi:MAG: DUF2971 domain-containing protein [Prevotella sp.]|nr:DUF2971 domain-containing protein [Prevotella sp.]